MKKNKNSKQISNQIQKNDSTNLEVLNINEVGDKVAEQAEISLREKNVLLSQAIENLLRTIEQKEEEILSLRNQISNPSPNQVVVDLPSEEELIIDSQIRMLKSGALTRELTLDEVKRFDLLIKNKKIINEDSKKGKTLDAKNNNKNVNDLVKLASKTIQKN